MFQQVFSLFVLSILFNAVHAEVIFESLCSSEVTVNGMISIDGSDDFEIDLYDTKFLPDDTIIIAIKQKRQNYGIHEFVLRAFDYDDNVLGRFDDRQTENLALKYHTCSNGASVIYVDRTDTKGYQNIPLTWKASGVDDIDEIVFRADIVSGRQLYRVKSVPLKRRAASGYIPHAADQSINLDYCGESQGCLVVPSKCSDEAKCEYTLSWQVIDNETAQFHIIARAQGFVGVGLSTDEKRGDDQVVLCTKDVRGHVYFHHMFVGIQTPQYILRNRPSYGLFKTDGYSNGTHIICKFSRRLSPTSEALIDHDGRHREGIDRNKLVDLHQAHYMYPIYFDQDLMTLQGMRIPVQDIAIINNHPVNFQRRIWPKSHPNAASYFVKIHAILNIIAWILLASAGVIVARYFDAIWPDLHVKIEKSGDNNQKKDKKKIERKFSIFTIFTPIIGLTALLSWIAFLFILIELNWQWTHGYHHLWHSILGLIVLICTPLAFLASLIRPKAGTKMYCCWYWMHWLILTVAHTLAVVVIFLGMDNQRLDLWNWCSWLLFGWCIFHTIIQLIFEIHACCQPKPEYYAVPDGKNNTKTTDRRISQARSTDESWKTALLGIYLSVTILVVIILIIAIILYQGY